MGRRLGQHFLNRRDILERIALAACPEPEPLVIEIGAGKGALTQHLLARAGQVVAIETDPFLVEYLTEKFAGVTNLTVVHADVLQADLSSWGPAVLVGNLPYYITSPILRRVLCLGQALRSAVFLVQQEVAERLTAQPGTREYGFLTVHALVYAQAELLFSVPAAAFRPPPQVDSAVVRLTPREPAVDDPERFLGFVAHCFQQKRKTLRNNLAGFFDRRQVDELPEASRRAEQLTLAEFVSLYRRLMG